MGSMLAVGLMSGTSLDGIDAALIETDGQGHIRPIAFRSDPYSAQARDPLFSRVYHLIRAPTGPSGAADQGDDAIDFTALRAVAEHLT